MTKETLAPLGHRIYERHRQIIRAIADKRNLKQAEALRWALEQIGSQEGVYTTKKRL